MQKSKEEATNRTRQYNDDDLNKAIEMSKLYSEDPTITSQIPSNPENMLRDKLKNMPAGIINIGNSCIKLACYFNSLLQIYFRLPFFVENVMSFEDPGFEKNQLLRKDSKEQKSNYLDPKSGIPQKFEKENKVPQVSENKEKRKLVV